MRKGVASIVLCVLAASADAKADRVDNFVRSEMAKHRIPGTALLVRHNGKRVKTAAYGLANLELAVPVRPETVFEIGSITKQFTAAAILLLAEEGKLKLDDPLRKYLPSVPETWNPITIRHLLTHTSGLKNYTALTGFELSRHLTQRQFIEAIGAQPLEFTPGSSWSYCNSGYNLLGFIIENQSGTNYWAFLRTHIFEPLGMSATTDRSPASVVTNRASGYERVNGRHVNRDYDLTDIFSAGAILSTVGDLARWDAALDHDDLLSATSKEMMWTPAWLASGARTKYGFGWFIDTLDGHPNLGHPGATSGFSASLQRFPDDHLTVILLTNTSEEIATPMARSIAEFFLPKPAKEK